MSRENILTGIIIVLLNINVFGQNFGKVNSDTENLELKQKLSYMEKMQILKSMNFYSEENENSSGIDQEVVFRILGIASLAGFFASVTLFNAEIFDSVPVTLLIAGIIFLIIGN